MLTPGPLLSEELKNLDDSCTEANEGVWAPSTICKGEMEARQVRQWR